MRQPARQWERLAGKGGRRINPSRRGIGGLAEIVLFGFRNIGFAEEGRQNLGRYRESNHRYRGTELS